MLSRKRGPKNWKSALAAILLVAAIVTLLLVNGGDGDGDGERSVAEIVDDARSSTVEVLASVDGELQGGGTGWVFDADAGVIVTNAHVINSGTTFEVALEDEEPRDAEILGVAPCDDLAVLRVDDTDGLRTLPLGDQESLELGDEIVALGFPGSASQEGNLTASSGVVSVGRTRFDLEGVDVPQYPNVIQTDTVINPGNSGGPLIDTRSRLVGVNSAGITLLNGRAIQGQGTQRADTSVEPEESAFGGVEEESDVSIDGTVGHHRHGQTARSQHCQHQTTYPYRNDTPHRTHWLIPFSIGRQERAIEIPGNVYRLPRFPVRLLILPLTWHRRYG